MNSLTLTSKKSVLMENSKRFILNGTEPPLYHLFYLLKAECSYKEAIEQVSEFCLVANSEANRRSGLEFLYAYGYLDKLETLINKNLNSENPTTRKWGVIYQVIHEWKKKETPPSVYLQRIKHLEIDEEELVCLKYFIHVYAHYERKQFGKLGSYLDRLIEGIHNLNDPLLQELFSIRLDELLMTYYWKRNEMIISRKHGYRILNRTYNECKKADIHNALALGFVYESYEQADYHGKEALRLAEKHGCTSLAEEVANQTRPFIAAYHGRTTGIVSTSLTEQAHLALSKGDREACIRLLAETKTLTPLQLFYLGKARRSKTILEESHHRFICEQSDYFFAKLPLLELNKLKTSF